jgi:YidC/Oxa1 family membrane protein insertase
MSSPTPDRNSPKELSNEVRMIIAFVLMGLILVATPFVYRKLGLAPPEPAPGAADAAAKAKKDAPVAGAASNIVNPPPPVAGGAPMATSATSPSEKSAAALAAPDEQDQVVDTKLYHVVFSNRGAVVKSWTLKEYKDAAGKPLEVINQPGAAKYGSPFSLTFRDKQPSADLNKALWVAHPDGLTLRFDFSDGQTTASKTFAFAQDAYLMQYADQVTLGGSGINHLAEWRGGFGDMAVQNAAGLQAAAYYDTEKNKLNRNAAKSAKNGPVNNDGKYSFAGLDDQYFAAVFLAPPDTGLQTTTFDDISASPFNASEEPYPGVAVGGASRNQLALYLGPKEINLLHSVNPKLDGLVDWGFFGVIAKPLFLVLHWIDERFIHNYGWAIILLTIVINLALFPLKLTNLKSMRRMQKIQPEMNKITEKYKGIGMSDPRAAQKQQEMMDLYKKHGVNPMGGCIPMLIQLPFLWAFYKVLAVTIEMRHASWLWVGDLSQPEHLGIRVLPVVLVATGFLLQKMTPVPTQGDPSQQKMMQFMPLMMGFFFWSASSGLVLYWLTGNLVGIAQQWFFNTTAGPVEAVAAKKAIAKDGRKRA